MHNVLHLKLCTSDMFLSITDHHQGESYHANMYKTSHKIKIKLKLKIKFESSIQLNFNFILFSTYLFDVILP
jgi:hypothetical protein